MKNLLILLIFAAFACNDSSQKETNSEERNSHEHIEHNSGENITPQVETDSSTKNRLEVDTISSSQGIQKEK